MTESINRYSSQEVLEIFKEQHRLCSPLDLEADSSVEITANMSISKWRRANDLLGWKELSRFLNQEFRIAIDESIWQQTLEPSKKRTLFDVCDLIATHAIRDYFQPKTIFGEECLKAGVFLTMKKNLKAKKVDVSELGPSSNLSFYINKYFSPVLEEITLTGTKTIGKLSIGSVTKEFSKTMNISEGYNNEIYIENIQTFRDLVSKIIDERNQKILKPLSK